MKISIVTPVLNGAKYIEDTIRSILSQEGSFELEYLIQDGGSKDGTLEIARRYAEQVQNGEYPKHCSKLSMTVVSEPDRGMYDAIQKGFAKTSGQIMAWLNSDDIYLKSALSIVDEIFQQNPDVKWLKGVNAYIDEKSRLFEYGQCLLYRQPWITRGHYGRDLYFLQQESVFWRRSLWDQAEKLNTQLKLAGDYQLWIEFSKVSELVVVQERLSAFRVHSERLTSEAHQYNVEMEEVAGAPGWRGAIAKGAFKLARRLPKAANATLYRLAFPTHRYAFFKKEAESGEYKLHSIAHPFVE